MLDSNKITDINILKKVHFPNLVNLWIENNKISNIDILKEVDFKNLKVLSLFKSNIKYKYFRKSKFSKFRSITIR